MIKQNPSKIANRYFGLIAEYAENFRRLEPEARLKLQKRIHNLAKMVENYAEAGLIKLANPKTKKNVFTDSTGSMTVYEI